jgi:chromosomal replication initiation ATPase DnaA
MAQASGYPVEQIRSHDQHKSITKVRKVTYTLIRDLTGMSYPEIGAYMNRDHSTVMSGCKSAIRSLAENERLRQIKEVALANLERNAA